MVKAKRARTVETPKLPSLCLRLCAPYFYPTRSHLQQRQAATCKDLLYKEDPKEEGGVMSSEVIREITLVSGNTRTRQRGSGHSVASTTEIVSGRRAGSSRG